jgi:hypothetical protein
VMFDFKTFEFECALNDGTYICGMHAGCVLTLG